MKTKLYLTMAAAMTLLMSVPALNSCCAPDDNKLAQEENQDDLMPFTQKQLPVIRDGSADGTVDIRFYEDLPSVPYIGISDFQRLMLPGSSVVVTKTGAGSYKLVNAGITATVSTVDETFAFSDYLAFTNLMGLVQQGMDNAYFDGIPYVRYSHQTLTGGSPAVTFDLGKYGINVRGDANGVYFPFTTLADIYTDLHFHNAHCDGGKVLVSKMDDNEKGIETFDPAFATENLMQRESRPADLAAYAYNELCFVIDNFYGTPGRSPYEAGIRLRGLDRTLEMTDDGQTVKQLLLSDKMEDYILGLEFLMLYMDDGGHTHTWNEDLTVNERNVDPAGKPWESLFNRYKDEYLRERYGLSLRCYHLMNQRPNIFGDDLTYHKKGDTAICHLDQFDPGSMEVFRDALKKADEDPEVKNLVIDLTLNRGGSSDIVVSMTSLMFGQSFVRCENTLTGQQVLWHYDIDRNFDGKFDSSDKDVTYDLKFCILTSSLSFSCGNMLPALCKDAGVMVAGEQCDGGGCAVGMYRTAEGFRYQISSARGRMADSQWRNIDAGVVPAVAIDPGEKANFVIWGKTFSQAGLDAFYDLDNLSRLIADYYN